MHYQQSCFVQADGLEALERRGGGERLEVVMECCIFREICYIEFPRAIRVHMLGGPTNLRKVFTGADKRMKSATFDSRLSLRASR